MVPTAIDEPTDEESLRDALEVVVCIARRNGVTVERDWPVRCPDDSDWAVDVARLDRGGGHS
jgi:hypothetical protein